MLRHLLDNVNSSHNPTSVRGEIMKSQLPISSKNLNHLLAYACHHEQIDTIHWLISQGADPNCLDGHFLTRSIQTGKTASLAALLAGGATVRCWISALNSALRSGNSATLRTLLTSGIGCTDKHAWDTMKSIAQYSSSTSLAMHGVLATFHWDENVGRVVEANE